jgi:hypothetical protein
VESPEVAPDAGLSVRRVHQVFPVALRIRQVHASRRGLSVLPDLALVS